MEILRTISLYAEQKGMRFVVIGGHAVNAHGISRQTGDIDILVPLSAKADWVELMKKLNYAAGQDDSRFARYRAVNLASWPIDFMYVNDTTFDEIHRESTDANFGEAVVRVASQKHLIAMKLHALKTFQEHRFAKDYSDLISLLRMQREKISREELKKMCLKYATESIFQRLEEDLERSYGR